MAQHLVLVAVVAPLLAVAATPALRRARWLPHHAWAPFATAASMKSCPSRSERWLGLNRGPGSPASAKNRSPETVRRESMLMPRTFGPRVTGSSNASHSSGHVHSVFTARPPGGAAGDGGRVRRRRAG